MRFIDEYRDAKTVRKIAASIKRTTTQQWKMQQKA